MQTLALAISPVWVPFKIYQSCPKLSQNQKETENLTDFFDLALRASQ